MSTSCLFIAHIFVEPLSYLLVILPDTVSRLDSVSCTQGTCVHEICSAITQSFLVLVMSEANLCCCCQGRRVVIESLRAVFVSRHHISFVASSDQQFLASQIEQPPYTRAYEDTGDVWMCLFDVSDESWGFLCSDHIEGSCGRSITAMCLNEVALSLTVSSRP